MELFIEYKPFPYNSRELNVAQNVNSKLFSIGCPSHFHLEVIMSKYMPLLPWTGDPAST